MTGVQTCALPIWNTSIRSGAIAGLYSKDRTDVSSNTLNQIIAPLNLIYGTDSTMILGTDETTEDFPVLCKSPGGRIWWKTISSGSDDLNDVAGRDSTTTHSIYVSNDNGYNGIIGTTHFGSATLNNNSSGGGYLELTNQSGYGVNIKATNVTSGANRVLESPNVGGTIALRAADSTASPTNMIYQGIDGLFHKAAVPGGGSTDTTSLSARIDLKLNKADTASLSNRINLKVNISDTASMLANYLRKIDTAVFSRKSMPAYSIRANNTSGTADATNFTFRSVGAQSISSGVPTWTAGTAPSGTENHSYTWSQIGKQVTVTFYLTYVTAGATCTAVSFPLPTDLPLPLELSGTGAADEFLYIGSGYIGTAKTTVPAVSARPTIRVNSGDTGYDIYMAGTSVSARVAYGTITYTAQ